MASSQVEIASSNQFGCVLRDHNRRDLCSRDGNSRQVAFRKNLKELVRDHLHKTTGVSVSSPDQNSRENRNPLNNNNGRHDKSLADTNQNQNKSRNSLTLSSRQEIILERWAARQAREMVSTIESQTQDSELLPSSSESSPSSSPISIPSHAALQSQNSDSQNLGASSLVQIWEARLHQNETTLNRSNSLTTHSNHSRTNSLSPTFQEESSRRSDIFDTFLDWESSTTQSLCSTNSRTSDAGDHERVRIADIIKRLTSDGNDHLQEQGGGNGVDSQFKDCSGYSSVSDQAEHRCLPRVLNAPKIRGRQAFNELRLQIERDRRKELDLLMERQAVSKFPQRGRIQSMLRLRFMYRGMATQEQHRPPSIQPTGSDTNKSKQGSTIMHLRERFCSAIKKATTSSDAAIPRSSPIPIKTVNTSVNVGNSSTQNQPNQDIHHHENSKQHITPPVESSSSQTGNANEIVHGEIATSSDVMCQRATLEVEKRYCSPPAESSMSQTSKASEVGNGETSGSSDVTCQETSLEVEQQCSPPIDNSEIHTSKVHEETSTRSDVSKQGTSLEIEQQIAPAVENSVSQAQEVHHEEASASSDINWQGEIIDVENLDPQETCETTQSLNDWDENEMEEESDDHQVYEQTNYDWFNDIARPRSYWEDRRQAWYQEMFSTTTDSNEIRQLLERRTVSTFLASDFREKMDQLMETRLGRQVGQEDEYLDEGSQDRMAQLMLSYFERHSHAEGSQEEVGEQGRVDEGQGEREGEEEQFSEEEGQANCHFLEAPGSFYESPSSNYSQSPFTSWNYNNHHGVAVNSEQVPTMSLRPPLPPKACDQNRYHSSMEMELIYDLRGHMKQLQREMSELRRSIQCCMEMQVKMQSSYKQEVHPVGGERNTSLDRVANTRNCCICYEKQVDTFLYRCGHMCTCLKCAHALQMSSGKCPICRAPIQDVVRAYMDF